jgi:hypothetical protein
MYDRSEPDGLAVIDRFDGGVGWLAHPAERSRRASHLLAGDDGVWLVDPLDAPGLDELVAEHGDVAGVAVFSNYHARDAGTLARRHGVAVAVPRWLDRAADRIDAPVDRYDPEGGSPIPGVRVERYAPLPGWTEAIAHRESDGTLYVPDVLGTAPVYTVGSERLGVYLLHRLGPPRELLERRPVRRVLVGHGRGVDEAAAEALATAIDGARRRFPRALVRHGPAQLRALLGALGG